MDHGDDILGRRDDPEPGPAELEARWGAPGGGGGCGTIPRVGCTRAGTGAGAGAGAEAGLFLGFVCKSYICMYTFHPSCDMICEDGALKSSKRIKKRKKGLNIRWCREGYVALQAYMHIVPIHVVTSTS